MNECKDERYSDGKEAIAHNSDTIDSKKCSPLVYFTEPESESCVYTPSNITGMYRRLISKYLKTTKHSAARVLPTLNKEQSPDHGDPLILVKRGSLSPSELGVMGGKRKGVDIPKGLPGSDSISGPDSKSFANLLRLDIEVSIFAETLAECETIGYICFKVLTAYSYDVMSKYIPTMKYVSPPTLTECLPSKKHNNRFECYINFNLTYTDESVLLIDKNMIKYIRMSVSEDESTNTIKDYGNFNLKE